ncbi:MAG TPA: DsbA family protein [Gammaproteobacteria bacterium]|nr:DsbA family protein [Gammaproteobacteria bacterium]
MPAKVLRLASLLTIALLAAPLLAAAPPAPASAAAAAVRIDRVVPAQPSGAGPDQIGVLVFFDFSPASQALMNYLEGWSARAGRHVALDREPLVTAAAAPLARAFVVARTLGVIEPVLPALFKLAAKEDPAAAPPTAMAVKGVFAPWGIDPIEFHAAWRSPVATDGVTRARALAYRFGVTTAPVIIVNGVWRLTPAPGTKPRKLIGALDARIAAAATLEAENQ